MGVWHYSASPATLGMGVEKELNSWASSATPAPITGLSCLGLVAADSLHLLRPPSPDTAFVPVTDQTGAGEDGVLGPFPGRNSEGPCGWGHLGPSEQGRGLDDPEEVYQM